MSDRWRDHDEVAFASPWVDPTVASTALSRAVILIRAALSVTAAGAGLRVVPHPDRLVVLIAAIVVTAVAEVAAVGRWPAVTRSPNTVVLVDSVTLVGALALGGPGIAYYTYAVGSAALAGTLMGLRAVLVWAGQAALGYAAAASLLHATQPAPDVAVFVLAFPMAAVVAGIGAATARAALLRYVRVTVGLVAAAQGSAAASERARLARELHDSVAKTLRGVSFAALALPTSLRRRPDLAEQLARTVSTGAEAAAREARQLVTALRLDRPDVSFVRTVDRICGDWSRRVGIPVHTEVGAVEPAIEVRYELTQILNEALANVARHAEASRVRVSLGWVDDALRLTIEDNGRGIPDHAAGPPGGSFGLVGMAERARAVGGVLRVRSEAGAGTRIDVVVPPASQMTTGVAAPSAAPTAGRHTAAGRRHD